MPRPSEYPYDKVNALRDRLTSFSISKPESLSTHSELVEYLGDLGVTQMIATAIRCSGSRIFATTGLLLAIGQGETARTSYAGPHLSLNRTHHSRLEGRSYHADASIPIIGANSSINTDAALPEGAFNASISNIGAREPYATYRSGVDVSEANDPNTLLSVVRDVALGLSFDFGGHTVAHETVLANVAKMPMELFTGEVVHGS
jgi:hypothetical protein